MTEPAPGPYRAETSGKPGSNGLHNLYLVDANGRKIAAIWGKPGEKEATAALFLKAVKMLEALAPLAAHANFLEEFFDGSELLAMEQETHLVAQGISVADCFRARAVIASIEGQQP